ncbi:MAG: hypothetical protein J1E43_11975 [Christensenellaceae bacterium]|nr:hypothetical protein [Christensenellaceae bacterium]
MLVKATKEDIEQYMDFAYSLAMDQTKSGYPLWSDGISTKDEFVDYVWKSYDNDDRDILLFIKDGVVEGWIQFFYLEQDQYLQTNGFLISSDTEQALTEFQEYACAHFAGYTLYLGFPKRNTDAISFLQKTGWRLIQESYHDIFVFDGSAIQPETAGIVKVTESNFSEFRKIHQTDSDTYWNSERIFSTLNEWLIYLLYREDVAVGYICARNGEIFSLGYRDNIFDKNTYKALVAVILSDLKTAGHKRMIFFNEEESQPTALELGFSCVSEYVLYIKSV